MMNPLRVLTGYIYRHWLKPDLDEFADCVVKNIRVNEAQTIAFIKDTNERIEAIRNNIIRLENNQ